MRVASLLLAAGLASTPAAVAQQNQTPGDQNAGGSSGGEDNSGSKANTAQAGANTTDGTTTGSSGPKPKQGGTPGNLTLPPLPSPEFCNAYAGPVQSACLATVTEETAGSLNGGQNEQ